VDEAEEGELAESEAEVGLRDVAHSDFRKDQVVERV
jgi:hypothetical protein